VNSVSVVIPVYNAELALDSLCAQLLPAMEQITDQFEVLLVEDCSQDDSWGRVQELARGDSRVRGIRLSRNYGQHNALLCGIRAARFEVIVTMDDDLQHPVSEIPVVLSKLQEGYDVVYGTPHQETHGLLRNLASQLTKLALRDVMGVENARSVSAFRAFKTSLRDGFADYRNPSVSIDVLLTWATSKFAAVPVRHEARSTGQSNYTLSKLVTHAFNLLTGFSTLPLRFASFIGVAFSIFGVLILTWVLGRFFISGSPVPGFPFLASMIAIFSGAQLLALGIFGEYLGRIHVRSLDRPAYLVREEADAADDATSKTLP
jgi:glycosyltransferase involved in cell wall biosynthesis